MTDEKRQPSDTPAPAGGVRPGTRPRLVGLTVYFTVLPVCLTYLLVKALSTGETLSGDARLLVVAILAGGYRFPPDLHRKTKAAVDGSSSVHGRIIAARRQV